MIYRKPQISDVVERQRGRRHAKASLVGLFTKPLVDEVDVEHQLAAPLLLFGIADVEPYPVNEVVVPSPDEIVVACAIILGVTYHQICSPGECRGQFYFSSSWSGHIWAPCNTRRIRTLSAITT
ncbi:hypothetical protein SF83666_b65740 (plasmid) [Sinorhizobium fredii CCBAU 83666]|nr:hypothetical protein SF83666_b65740 [Sinorhizobium fredii CCBAU 83666]